MDIEQIRKDTPYCRNKIFLNSAGASLMPNVVVQKIYKYLLVEEQLGGYKAADLRKEELEEFYIEAAKLLNCTPRNIAFAHDATHAYNKALSAIPFAAGDVILTTDNDYVSNQINFLMLQKRHKIKILRVKNLENGDIDLVNLKQLINKHKPRVVAVTHIPTNSGLVQDVAKIGEICMQADTIFLLDACQSVGQIVVDVKKIKCDFLSVTGRKFLRGPRGTGLLYVSDRLLDAYYSPLFLDARGATWTDIDKIAILDNAKRFETWESPLAMVIGLKEAFKYANKIGMKTIEDYNQDLIQRLRSNLRTVPKITLFDKGSTTCNILTFQKEGVPMEKIKQYLDKHKVYYTISTREYALIDFDRKGISWVVRLSPHYFNTIEEMDKVAEIIEKIP